MFVSEFSTNRIRWIGDDGIVTNMVAGGAPGFGGDGGPKQNARFSGPNSIILAPDYSLIVFDSGNNRIRRIDATNVYTLYGNGQSNSDGDNGPASNAGLNFPTGGVYGKDGSLYVVEGIGHKVRRIAPNGIITTLAGTGVAGYSGDSGPANAAQLNHPRAIAISNTGSELYVTEQNRVRVINLNTGTINLLAGNGQSGTITGYKALHDAPLGGSWISASGSIQNIGALSSISVLPDDDILVSDRANHKIYKIRLYKIYGYSIAPYAGNGIAGYSEDGFYDPNLMGTVLPELTRISLNQPGALHTDKYGNVYFSDFFNFAVRQFTPTRLDTSDSFVDIAKLPEPPPPPPSSVYCNAAQMIVSKNPYSSYQSYLKGYSTPPNVLISNFESYGGSFTGLITFYSLSSCYRAADANFFLTQNYGLYMARAMYGGLYFRK